MIELWTIYDHPKDYPDEFVGRRIVVRDRVVIHDFEPFARGASAEDVRDCIPEGAYRIGPTEADDPVICEVWIT